MAKLRKLTLQSVGLLLRAPAAAGAAGVAKGARPDPRLLAIDVGSSNCGLALSGPGPTA